MSKKYKVIVSTYVRVSKVAGYIECDSFEEYDTIMARDYENYLEEGHISTNISNDFELDGDVEVQVLDPEDLKYYLNE